MVLTLDVFLTHFPLEFLSHTPTNIFLSVIVKDIPSPAVPVTKRHKMYNTIYQRLFDLA